MRLVRLQAEGFKHLRGIDLVFPPKGTFLISGNNEAGKSSLFEVVFFTLFARPLQARSSEELIGYGLNEAKTYLELDLGRNILRVERTIRRNRTNTVKLVIGDELITTAKEANRRIQEELHLDADTLLNSCFVEQKGLEKLEGLDKSARESAVMKLLNLERMQALEEELRVKREDERVLEEWKKKMRIAEIKEQMPSLQKEIEHYERLRGFREAEKLREEAEAQRKQAEEEEKKIPILEEKRNECQRKVQELRKLRDKEHKLDNLLNALRFVGEKETHLDSVNKQLEEIQGARKSLPQLEKLKRKVESLLHLHKRLALLTEWVNKAKEWQSLKRQINEEQSKVELLQEEKNAKSAQGEKKRKNIEVLGRWRDLKAKEDKMRQREKMSEELGRLATQMKVSVIASALLLLIFLLFSPIKWLSAIAVLPLIAGGISYEKRKNLQIKLAQLTGEIGTVDMGDLRATEAELAERGLLEQVAEGVERVIKKEEEELKVIEMDLEKIENDIIRANERQEVYKSRLASGFPELPSEMPEEEVARRVEKIEGMLNRWLVKLEEIASQFNLPADEERLRSESAELRNRIKNFETLIQQEDGLLEIRKKDEEEIDKLKQEIGKIAKELEELDEDIYTRDKWDEIKKEVKRKREQLEKEEVEKKLQEAIGRLKAQEQKVASYREMAEGLEKKAQGLLAKLGEPPEHLPTLEEINSALDDRRAELRRLEKELEELQLQIVGDVPSYEQCKMEYEKLERELKVRQWGAKILETARQNITRKILPRTVERMWSILPLITNDRYRQVELSEETFRIRVYDERAGDWKDKNIFSGGTRDQMSLALRLAFALAALPKERGTAPRFLFLDEPLSSFDEQRREALIRVITEGEIAEAFDQIFVISHTPLLNPNLFHYYLVMENGRIKECSEELIPPERRGSPLL